jgi:hypothetical protein
VVVGAGLGHSSPEVYNEVLDRRLRLPFGQDYRQSHEHRQDDRNGSRSHRWSCPADVLVPTDGLAPRVAVAGKFKYLVVDFS